MKHLYHYHAIWEPNSGQTGHADGTCETTGLIKNHEDYRNFKKQAAEEYSIDPAKITICTLNLIYSGN